MKSPSEVKRRIRKVTIDKAEYQRLLAQGVGCNRMARMFGCAATSICELARRRGWR